MRPGRERTKALRTECVALIRDAHRRRQSYDVVDVDGLPDGKRVRTLCSDTVHPTVAYARTFSLKSPFACASSIEIPDRTSEQRDYCSSEERDQNAQVRPNARLSTTRYCVAVAEH